MNVIERAYELAQSGGHPTIDAIRNQLSREGFLQVDSHLGGRLIRRQLTGMIGEAARHRRED